MVVIDEHCGRSSGGGGIVVAVVVVAALLTCMYKNIH